MSQLDTGAYLGVTRPGTVTTPAWRVWLLRSAVVAIEERDPNSGAANAVVYLQSGEHFAVRETPAELLGDL